MILLRHCLTRFKGSCRCLEFLIPVGRHLSLEYILSVKLCFPFFFHKQMQIISRDPKLGQGQVPRRFLLLMGLSKKESRASEIWLLRISCLRNEGWCILPTFMLEEAFWAKPAFHQELWTYSGCDYETMCLSILDYELEISIAWQGQSSMNCHAQLSRTDIDTDHSSCFQWQCFFLSKLNE